MADVGCAVIVGVVAKRFGFEADDLVGRSRTGGLVRARHLAMAVARSTLGRSYPELGRAFGRDHTSVVTAVQGVARRVGEDEREARLFRDLEVAATRALAGEFGGAERTASVA